MKKKGPVAFGPVPIVAAHAQADVSGVVHEVMTSNKDIFSRQDGTLPFPPFTNRASTAKEQLDPTKRGLV